MQKLIQILMLIVPYRLRGNHRTCTVRKTRPLRQGVIFLFFAAKFRIFPLAKVLRMKFDPTFEATRMSQPEAPKRTFQELTTEHEQSGYLTKTKNSFGWQMNVLDEFGEDFVKYAATCKKPILDLGVAYGYTSKRLLEAGATVIANELSSEMLEELPRNLSADQNQRLQTIPGNAMDLVFGEGMFDGIMANRFIQFILPEEFRALMERWSRWLAPGGKLCLTGPSVYFSEAAAFHPRYLAAKERGEEWPGLMEKPEVGHAQVVEGVPRMHWLDVDILEREAKRAGLRIEKLGYVPRPYASNNGKEGVGVIASKPK